MVIAKLYVSGTRAAVYGLQKVPSGIVGAVIELSFGNDWNGLNKTAVFRGVETKDVVITGDRVTIPAACVSAYGHRLQVGFYGVLDENLVIPTIWADLGVIQDAANPSGDTSIDPELPVWAQLQDQINDMKGSKRIAEIYLPASNWSGGGSLFRQVVTVDGVTENSQVDLTPDVEQLAIFYDKSLALVAENEGGVVTVYAIGQKPENDYTIQATITEVYV